MKHTKKITILHSNDLHGDFLAEQVDEKLVGGVSMLSGYIEKVRAEEPNTIYAIAGDMFRGSVIDSEYKGLSTMCRMRGAVYSRLQPSQILPGMCRAHEADQRRKAQAETTGEMSRFRGRKTLVNQGFFRGCQR